MPVSHSVMFDSATPRNVDCWAPLSVEFSTEYWSALPSRSLGIFLTQGSNPGLLHCRQILYHLSHQGSKHILKNKNNVKVLRSSKYILCRFTEALKVKKYYIRLLINDTLTQNFPFRLFLVFCILHSPLRLESSSGGWPISFLLGLKCNGIPWV